MSDHLMEPLRLGCTKVADVLALQQVGIAPTDLRMLEKLPAQQALLHCRSCSDYLQETLSRCKVEEKAYCL